MIVLLLASGALFSGVGAPAAESELLEREPIKSFTCLSRGEREGQVPSRPYGRGW
jgi:hypothetical protein